MQFQQPQMCVCPCETCNENYDFKHRIQIKIKFVTVCNQGYEEQLSLRLLNLSVAKYMPNTVYYSCYFELFQCFLMDSHTNDYLERQAL